MAAPANDASGIRQTIRALKAADYTLDSVNNGGEDDEPVTTEAEAMAECLAADTAALYVHNANNKYSYVYFVLGNEPYEVINNYSVDLEPVLGPLTDKWNADVA